MRGQRRRGGGWVEPACIVAFFAVFSLSGFLWGLAVRTPHPDINSIAMPASARDVQTPTPRPRGLASPTGIVINSTREGLINYVFTTPDPPAQVIAFYKTLMLKQYGFPAWTLDQRSDGALVLQFERGTIQRFIAGVPGQDVEHVTVTVLPGAGDGGQTRVEVRRDTTVYTGPPR